jgi:hypothetical protein
MLAQALVKRELLVGSMIIKEWSGLVSLHGQNHSYSWIRAKPGRTVSFKVLTHFENSILALGHGGIIRSGLWTPSLFHYSWIKGKAGCITSKVLV